jgi:hypothetical protein
MASASSIARLHRAGEQMSTFRTLPQPEAAPVKSVNFTDSQAAVFAPTERRMRGRFRRFQPVSPEAGYSLTPEIMSPQGDIAPLDRSFQFAAMAERERLQAVAQRYLARGMHGR